LTFIILAYLIISYLTPDTADNTIEGFAIQLTGPGVSSIQAVEKIKTMVQKQKDIFLIPKYNKNYEQIILQAEELLNIQMLNQVIALINNGATQSTITSIVSLKQAKDALADVMKYNDEASKA
jgi:NADPH:quinone reductase-like Zn-dependent oxidoreductase